MKRHIFFGFLYLLIISCTSGKSQEITKPIPLDPELRYGRLDNGFTYYIRNTGEMDLNDNQGISLMLIGPGERFEDEDQLGLAHLIEHMNVLYSSPDFLNFDAFSQKNDLSQFRKDYAMLTGPYCTTYAWGIPENNPELLTESFQRLRIYAQSQKILESLQDPKEVDIVGRQTVMQEYNAYGIQIPNWENNFKILNRPSGHRYGDKVKNYQNHNQNIKTFELESLVSFYKDWYRPDKQAIVIVGNVNVDEIEKQVKSIFSDLKTPKNPPRKSFEEFLDEMRIHLPGKSQLILHTDPRNSDLMIELYFKKRAQGTIRTEEQYRTYLMNNIYESLIHSRMALLNQQYDSPYQRDVTHHLKDFGVVQVEASVFTTTVQDIPSIPEAFQLITKELERIRRYGFTKVELAMAKEKVLKMANKSLNERRDLVYQFKNHFLFGAAAPSHNHKLDMTKRLLESIQREDINSAASNWLNAPDNDIVITAPDIKNPTLPNKAKFLQWNEQIKRMDISQHEEEDVFGPTQLLSSGELQKLDKDVSYKQEEIRELGVTTLLLNNGMKVFLKPMKTGTKGDLHLTGISQIGASSYKGKERFMALNSSDIVMNGGAGTWDKFDLARYNQNRMINVNLRINENATSINGSATEKHLEDLLQQVYLYITAPNKNEQAFEDWLNQEHGTVALRNSSDKSFNEMVSEEILGKKTESTNHYKFEDIQLDRVYQIYRDLFTKTGKFTYAIAGDFKVAEIKPLLIKYLGSLPIPNNENHTNSIATDMDNTSPQGGIYKTLYSKDKENFGVSINFLGKFSKEEETILKLDTLEEILGNALWTKSRKEGYYRGANFIGTYQNDYYRFIISYRAKDLQTIEKFKSIVLNSIYEFQEYGPNKTDLQRAILKLKNKKIFNDPTPIKWSNYLLEQNYNGWDFKSRKKRTTILDNITQDDIQKTARKYLAKDSLSIIEMRPEKELDK